MKHNITTPIEEWEEYRGMLRAWLFVNGDLYVMFKDGIYQILPCTDVRFIKVERDLDTGKIIPFKDVEEVNSQIIKK